VSIHRSIKRTVVGLLLVPLGFAVGTWLAPIRPNLWWDAICSCGAVAAIVLGTLMVLQASVPTFPSAALQVIATASILLYFGWYALTVAVLAFHSSGSWGHCDDLRQPAIQTGLIPQSVSQPNLPSVFCLVAEYGIFRSHYQVLEIYGVPRQGQATVLEAVRNTRLRLQTEPVQVLFYDRENWRTWSNPKNGASGGSRGPETVQRVVVIR